MGWHGFAELKKEQQINVLSIMYEGIWIIKAIPKYLDFDLYF